MPSAVASHTPCAASKPTVGSLARGSAPGCGESEVMPGRSPDRQWLPASADVATPIAVAPPFSIRPTWNTATIVFPKAKLSGSTSVACCPPPPVSVSVEISRLVTSQPAPNESPRSAFTTSTPGPHEIVSRIPSPFAAIESLPAAPTSVSRPGPPRSTSFPAMPSSVSLPAKPSITSDRAVPTSRSARLVPVIRAANAAVGARTRSVVSATTSRGRTGATVANRPGRPGLLASRWEETGGRRSPR